MKTAIEIVKSVGFLGAIAVGLLIYYTMVVQGLSAKELIDGDLKASDLAKAAPVLTAVILFMGQIWLNQKTASNEIKFADERARRLVEAEGRDIARKVDEAAAAAAADRKFWAALDGHLRDRRALMDHDEPHYVSAVVDSAYLLRERVSTALETYSGVSGPIRNYALLLRDAIKDFLDEVETVEKKAGTALKSAGLDRWQLEKLCRERQTENIAYGDLIPCDTDFERAHSRWRARTQALVYTTAALLELPAPPVYQARRPRVTRKEG